MHVGWEYFHWLAYPIKELANCINRLEVSSEHPNGLHEHVKIDYTEVVATDVDIAGARWPSVP